MKKSKLLSVIVLTSLFLIVLGAPSVFAHNPPTANQMDCGLIVGGVFYSSYYSPGNPNGTPATSGSCAWTRTSNNSCGTYYYGGQNYTLYPYKFTCSVPLDTNIYLLITVVGLIGFFKVRTRFSESLLPRSS